jgi:aminoglycoside phosphotransferase (APT) family kinase protein
VNQPSFADQMRKDASVVPQYLEKLAQLQALVHTHPAHRFATLKLGLATNIERARLIDERRRQILLSRLAEMPNDDRLCHGDFHPINVLGQASDPIVIDWPDATCGDPAADVCRSYLLLKLHAEEIAGPYLDAYCRVSPGIGRARVRQAVPRRRGSSG